MGGRVSHTGYGNERHDREIIVLSVEEVVQKDDVC